MAATFFPVPYFRMSVTISATPLPPRTPHPRSSSGPRAPAARAHGPFALNEHCARVIHCEDVALFAAARRCEDPDNDPEATGDEGQQQVKDVIHGVARDHDGAGVPVKGNAAFRPRDIVSDPRLQARGPLPCPDRSTDLVHRSPLCHALLDRILPAPASE